MEFFSAGETWNFKFQLFQRFIIIPIYFIYIYIYIYLGSIFPYIPNTTVWNTFKSTVGEFVRFSVSLFFHMRRETRRHFFVICWMALCVWILIRRDEAPQVWSLVAPWPKWRPHQLIFRGTPQNAPPITSHPGTSDGSLVASDFTFKISARQESTYQKDRIFNRHWMITGCIDTLPTLSLCRFACLIVCLLAFCSTKSSNDSSHLSMITMHPVQ